jgi:hypothetical protein
MIDRLEIEIKLPSTVSRDDAMTVSEECYDRHFFDAIDKVISRYSAMYDFDIDNINIDLGKIRQDNIPSTLETLLTKAIEEKLPKNSDEITHLESFSQNPVGFDADVSLNSKLSLFTIVWDYLRKGLVSHKLESLFLDSANYKNSSFLRKDIANASPIVSSDGQSENEPPRQYSSKSTELVQHSSEITDSDRYPSDKVTADYDSYASHHQIGQKIAVRNYGDIDASQNALLDDQPENEENYQFSSEFDRYSSNEETVVDSDSYTSRLQIEQILAARNYDEIIDLIKSDSLALIRLSNVVDKEFLLHLSESLIERYSGRKISHEIIGWAGKNLEKESVASLISMILNDDEYAPRILDSIRNDDSDLKRQLIEYYYSLFESRLPLFEADQEVREKRFHLEDAGLVLLAPFISTLFSRLGYLDENGCFESVASQFRAIILLRRVVFPEVVEIHDYELNLCKVLCGVNPAFPIPTDIQLGEDEKNEIDHLLESVIDYWTIINGTSTDGFRSSFLKRFGTLEKSENMWIVRVEGSTIDILMEDLPWSFSALSYSWCQDVIYVEWQKPL